MNTLIAQASASTFEPSTSPALAVSGIPRAVLRLEGMAALLAALFAYPQLGQGWGFFFALFLLPDLALLGYLINARVGAHAYNAAHSYLGPALLAAASLVVPGLLPLVAIWVAHIGFDRMLGYGLKYTSAFHHTHLGHAGRSVRA
jgi:hypothetical protein